MIKREDGLVEMTYNKGGSFLIDEATWQWMKEHRLDDRGWARTDQGPVIHDVGKDGYLFDMAKTKRFSLARFVAGAYHAKKAKHVVLPMDYTEVGTPGFHGFDRCTTENIQLVDQASRPWGDYIHWKKQQAQTSRQRFVQSKYASRQRFVQSKDDDRPAEEGADESRSSTPLRTESAPASDTQRTATIAIPANEAATIAINPTASTTIAIRITTEGIAIEVIAPATGTI